MVALAVGGCATGSDRVADRPDVQGTDAAGLPVISGGLDDRINAFASPTDWVSYASQVAAAAHPDLLPLQRYDLAQAHTGG